VSGVAVLASLFLLLRPGAGIDRSPTNRAQSFVLAVRDGRLASGPALLQVRQGEPVRLTVTSNRADELHLHGYDLHLLLRPDQPAVLEFPATSAGHFAFELHQADVELGALEVMPQ
jgi:hypothetical protein